MSTRTSKLSNGVLGANPEPGKRAFAEALLEGHDADVLACLGEHDVASLVENAWATFRAERRPGFTIASNQIGDVTVLDIHNDDMPFLVDSVVGEIQHRGLAVRTLSHPTFKTTRGTSGELVNIRGLGDQNWRDHQESVIQIIMVPMQGQELEELRRELSAILDNIRLVVGDWQKMVDRIAKIAGDHSIRLEAAPNAALSEAVAFLEWLAAGNFTVLGVQELELVGEADNADLQPLSDRGLGILRDPTVSVLRRGTEMVHMTPEVRHFFFQTDPIIVTKANVVSKIHRRVHMDYVGVKLFGAGGRIRGELRIVGLFTAGVYNQSVARIPLLRRKVEHVVEGSSYAPDSHNGKALVNVLETFPRDELFQIPPDVLQEWTEAIHDLDLRPRPRVLARVDDFDRFVSALVYVPRDRYTTEVRQRIGDFLSETYAGRLSAFFPYFQQGPLVRIQFIIGRYSGETPVRSREFLEESVIAIIRTWSDDLADRLGAALPAADAGSLGRKYATAFPTGYQELFGVRRALEDISRLERLTPEAPVSIDFYSDPQSGELHAALYRLGPPIPLSQRVPVLEHLGFSVIDERSYEIDPVSSRLPQAALDDIAPRANYILHDMILKTDDGSDVDMTAIADPLEHCYLAVWRDETESDGFNRLIRLAGADWRQAAMMRAYANYLRQIRSPFGPRLIADTIARHAAVAGDLLALFAARFDPAYQGASSDRESVQGKARADIEAALANVPSLDDDRILRSYLNLMQSTVRTNFYRLANGGNPPSISFKIRSATVDGMPAPRPYAEIFVHSTRVEGVHLRFAPIARGGLRWSDRQQDFRTEVLGLVKAQQVKNAVIVPAGAKGGFFPKHLPRGGTREEVFAEGTEAYKLFVSSLLEITDNLDGETIVPPDNVIRHDGDDPYLVVAADKGTATFSDTANAISESHGFWLGDAFASGGSAGYDHKKMGITARGAWESVKRHFREMDHDIQTKPFTAIGVGDMSGDVFGNGMLLSPATRLLAAFDHRDIFIDPEPDCAASFAERKRLFEMGRSSWQDYEKSLISAGGGIFSRSAKSIVLTPEIKALTGLSEDTVPPNRLINALLKSDADLLWFGGIGTYVRGPGETDEEVGDRANDSIRVNASELRVKVVGEGANLGMTQPARIAFAQHGGRINTDFIDNSAGVNSSDMEVNIKVALRPVVASGRLDGESRNALLAGMTEEVAQTCLRNNYLQSLAISLAEQRGTSDLGFQQRLMRQLEHDAGLDRAIEYLPDDSQIAERMKASAPLTRPELSVLLCYAKNDLYQRLLRSDLPDDPHFETALIRYFPQTLREGYADDIRNHRLRREIIATVVANDVINRGGSTIIIRLGEETGHGAASIALAYAAMKEIFDLSSLTAEVDALDNRISGEIQNGLYLQIQNLVRRQTAWILRNAPLSGGLARVIEPYRDGCAAFERSIAAIQGNTETAGRTAQLAAAGVPQVLAERMSRLTLLADAPVVTRAALSTGKSVDEIAPIFLRLDKELRLGELRAAAEDLRVSDYYDRLAINSTLAIISDAHRSLTESVFGTANGAQDPFADWSTRRQGAIRRTTSAVADILDGGELTLARLAVAASQVRELAI